MNPSTQPRLIDPDSRAVEALAKLPRDLAVIKMENDSILAAAAAHPRDHHAIVAEMKSQFDAYPKLAEGARYSKPVGRVEICPRCKAETRYKKVCPKCGAAVPMKIARGLSVRTAETAAALYKYNRIRATVTDLDNEKV